MSPVHGGRVSKIQIVFLSLDVARAALTTPLTRKRSKITETCIIKSAKIRGPPVLAYTANLFANKVFAK